MLEKIASIAKSKPALYGGLGLCAFLAVFLVTRGGEPRTVVYSAGPNADQTSAI